MYINYQTRICYKNTEHCSSVQYLQKSLSCWREISVNGCSNFRLTSTYSHVQTHNMVQCTRVPVLIIHIKLSIFSSILESPWQLLYLQNSAFYLPFLHILHAVIIRNTFRTGVTIHC